MDCLKTLFLFNTCKSNYEDRNKKYVKENIEENCQKEIRNFTYHCIYTTSLHSDSSLEV